MGAGFGLVTIVIGVRTLTGLAQPGYPVFGPLLWFNTLMGFGYLLAAGLIWRDVRRGRNAAGVIAAANLVVFGVVSGLRAAGGGVASESVKAMAFRTIVWLGLLATLRWATRRATLDPPATDLR